MAGEPMQPKPKQKGSYGPARLPVARAYVLPRRRRRALLIGAALALALALWLIYDFFGRDARFISSGPLSSGHAMIEADCAACHASFAEVEDTRCATCHEKLGDPIGTYSFAKHYLYRENDFNRVVPSPDEVTCATCHGEHHGREASLVAVADARCATCHFASFDRQHPQFDFAAEGQEEQAGIAFAHVHHVREVMKQRGLVDLERACLACHNPQADGRGFAPIDFDAHCDECHLTIGTATARLPIHAEGELGVETLDAIRDHGGPGTRWAWFADPNEFQAAGGRVRKSPLHHEDAWILYNLRRLRTLLVPGAGLADLLETTADVPAHEVEALYREALATLGEQALGLRGRAEPEVQAELARIITLIEGIERRLEDPLVALDETDFLLALEPGRDGAGGDAGQSIEALAAELTAPCLQCHSLRQATIVRVQKDQRSLRRAEFDHRAHILQARCLDCHRAIPIEEAIASGRDVEPEEDRAAILDLPSLETCQQCHTARLASNRCVTCHLFHPDKDRSARLLLYHQPGDA